LAAVTERIAEHFATGATCSTLASERQNLRVSRSVSVSASCSPRARSLTTPLTSRLSLYRLPELDRHQPRPRGADRARGAPKWNSVRAISCDRQFDQLHANACTWAEPFSWLAAIAGVILALLALIVALIAAKLA